MINLTRQKIGIFYRNAEWGKQCFNYIISQISQELIYKKTKDSCYLKNDDEIRLIYAGDSARGHKLTAAVVQDGIDWNVLHNIIYPCVKTPVAVCRSVKDIVANYVTIKQDLPRKRRKFVRIKVRY